MSTRAVAGKALAAFPRPGISQWSDPHIDANLRTPIEIDARGTPFDAVVAASGKCLEGPPGMGFVITRRAVLERSDGNSHSLAMDLHDQWVYMEKTTQWRYTPLTHVVAAFDAAIAQYLEEGGLAARGARYAHNCRTLIEGMARLGLRSYLPAAWSQRVQPVLYGESGEKLAGEEARLANLLRHAPAWIIVARQLLPLYVSATLGSQATDRLSIRQVAEGRRILFGDSTIAAWANLSTGCR